jgi:hypothetical protein
MSNSKLFGNDVTEEELLKKIIVNIMAEKWIFTTM